MYLPPRSRYANNNAEHESLAAELEKVKTRLDALERTVNRKVAAGTILGALLGGLLGGAFARRSLNVNRPRLLFFARADGL